MSIRSPIDNDSRLPPHWSSIDNEMDRRLDAVGKVQDDRYAQHLPDEAKQAAKKKFIDNVKKVFIAQAEALHGSAHDSKHPMLVNYAMSRLRGDENSFLDKASPAKAMPADDAKQLLQSFQDGIADAAAADEPESSSESGAEHGATSETRQQSYAAAGAARSTKHYYDSTSMLKNTQMSVDTAVSKLSFKTMSRAAFLGAQSAVQSMHGSTMLYAAELNQTSAKHAAVQKKLSAKAQFNQTLNMLPQNVRQSKLIAKYGFSMFGGMDSMQILAAVKTLSALDRMTGIGADIASKQSDDDHKRLKSMNVKLDGMLTAAKIYRRDKGIMGKLKRALQDTFIGKIQSFITDAFGGIFKVFGDIKKLIVDRFFGAAKKKIIDYFSKAFRALGKVISKTVKLFAKFVDIAARWIGNAIRRIIGLIYKVCVAAVKMLGSWGGRALAAAKRWTASALKRMKDAFKASRLGRWLARAKTAISSFTKTRVLQPMARFFGRVMKPFKAAGHAIGAAWRASKSFVSRAYAATARHIASWGRSFAQFAGNIVRHIHISPKGGWISLMSRAIMKCPVIGTILRYTGKAIHFILATKIAKGIFQFIVNRILRRKATQLAVSKVAIFGSGGLLAPFMLAINIIWLAADIADLLHFIFPDVKWIYTFKAITDGIVDEYTNIEREGILGWGGYIQERRAALAAKDIEEHGYILGSLKSFYRQNKNFLSGGLLGLISEGVYTDEYDAIRTEYEEKKEHIQKLIEIKNTGMRRFRMLSRSEKDRLLLEKLDENIKKIRELQTKAFEYEMQHEEALRSVKSYNTFLSAIDLEKANELLYKWFNTEKLMMKLAVEVGIPSYSDNALKMAYDRFHGIKSMKRMPDIRKALLDEEELRKHAEESRKISEEWKSLADGLAKDLKAKSRECLIDLQSISGKLNQPDSAMPGADNLFDSSDVLLLVQ